MRAHEGKRKRESDIIFIFSPPPSFFFSFVFFCFQRFTSMNLLLASFCVSILLCPFPRSLASYTSLLVLALFLLFVSISISYSSAWLTTKKDFVTCGSVITLGGNKAGTQLACKEVQYGGHGSGQNACTGMTNSGEPDRYFIVRGTEEDGGCLQGTKVKKGMKIRLQHKESGRWLHSHRIRSMMTNNQEVSCFGDVNNSDDSDVWRVTWSGGGKHWESGDKFYLQHDITKHYLGSLGLEYPQPLQGQKEVVAMRTKTADTLFSVAEGIYFPQRAPPKPQAAEKKKDSDAKQEKASEKKKNEL